MQLGNTLMALRTSSSILRTGFALALAALLLTAASTGWAAQPTNKGKPLYKWVDENGVTHYGDRVPPKYAQQERTIVNKQGVTVDRLEGRKSDAQRAEDAAKLQAAKHSRERDRMLISTYLSTAQIEELRDQRLDMIEGQVKVTAQYLDTLNGRLKKLQNQASNFKPYNSKENAPRMPDQLAEDLVRTLNEIHVQQVNLDAKRVEQTTLRQQFQSDIDRFTELKNGGR
jgi:hypothetical protein